MGKKFEGAHPTSQNIVKGYLLLGLGKLLGSPGPHTAAEFRDSILSDEVEVYCLPGNFTGSEILALFKHAGLGAA